MRYLLDTSTISGLSRPRPPPTLVEHLTLHQAVCATASLVVAELRFGARRHPDPVRRDRLMGFVDHVIGALPVLPFDEPAAEWLAGERARLEAAGTVVDLADLVIAATAAARGLVLVTSNVRHFRPLRIDVEDWSHEP